MKSSITISFHFQRICEVVDELQRDLCILLEEQKGSDCLRNLQFDLDCG